MGTDWKLVFKHAIWGTNTIEVPFGMSGNFNDIWEKVGSCQNQLHGNNGAVIAYYLNLFISKMTLNALEVGEDNIITVTIDSYKRSCDENINYPWGTDVRGEPLEENAREAIFLYQLKRFRNIAEEHPEYYWFGDNESYYIGHYVTREGKKFRGYRSEEDYRNNILAD